jgi:2-polyprenyl-6-methoxyphenol hydroxylase-like FAD-dependent oxidoreductase
MQSCLQKEIPSEIKASPAEIVFVGAGPIGLATAIKLKEGNKDLPIVMLERHEKYERTQILKLQVDLIKNEEMEKELWELTKINQATANSDKKCIDIPIQTFEAFLLKHAKKNNISIEFKRFLTTESYEEELKKHNVSSKNDLEKELKEKIIVGSEQILGSYPKCKIIIGADGARSSVRDMISQDEKTSVNNKDLRKLIEIKYSVKGAAYRINPLLYHHTHIYLNGILITEQIKHNKKTVLKGNKLVTEIVSTEVVLRLTVDDETYNDAKLKDVNAKNLLRVTADNIPKKLYHALNIWVHKRLDRNIIPASVKLNKTSLGIYSSKKLHSAKDHCIAVVVGDAACGFPYQNGLNIGLKNAAELAQLICKNYQGLTANDGPIVDSFFKQYDEQVQKTYKEGEQRVTSIDNKIASSTKFAKAMHNVAFSSHGFLRDLLYKEHSLFRSYNLFDRSFSKYNKSVPAPSLDKFYLNNQLIRCLQQAGSDFSLIYAILAVAYTKNLSIELEKSKIPTMKMLFNMIVTPALSLKQIENATIDMNKIERFFHTIGLVIPHELTASNPKIKLQQRYHQLITHAHERVYQCEQDHLIESRHRLTQCFSKGNAVSTKKIADTIDLVEQFAGLNCLKFSMM